MSEDTSTSAAKTTHKDCCRYARVGGLLPPNAALAVERLDLLDAPPLLLRTGGVGTRRVAAHDPPPPLCLSLLDGSLLVLHGWRAWRVRGVNGIDGGQFGQDEMRPLERPVLIIGVIRCRLVLHRQKLGETAEREEGLLWRRRTFENGFPWCWDRHSGR